jgi:hypothetical protein
MNKVVFLHLQITKNYIIKDELINLLYFLTLDYLEANRRQLICVNRLISVTDILPYFTQLYCLIYIYMMETLYS